MKYFLPANNLYGNEPVPVEFPDNWDVHVCTYRGADAPKLSYREIYDRIASPDDGTPSILEGARGKKDAVIIFDDIIRPTPCGEIAKAIIAQLEEAGVPRNKIRFVCAVGGHRAMGREEFVRKLGEDIVSEFRIYNHNPFFNNVKVGVSKEGYDVELNAECVAADYKIGIGALFAHPPTGLGGGPKLIMPGICSFQSICSFHGPGNSGTEGGSKSWNMDVIGRKRANEACEMLGLDYKIDVLHNGKGEVAGIYAGHYDKNTTAHLDEIKSFFTTRHAGMGDLVIVNNYFKPTEISNAVMPDTKMYDMVRPGGDIILSSHTPGGVATHYMFGIWGDTGIHGPLAHLKPLPDYINHCYIFASYPELGHGLGWVPTTEQNPVTWHKSWAQIMERLGNRPRKVIIAPYALVSYFDPPFTRVEEPAFCDHPL